MAEEREERRKKELLDAVRQARSDFEALQDEVDDAKDGYHEAVRSLNEAGMPLREIAEHLGLSHQRVHQMLTAERTSTRRKNVARGLGAAGVMFAIVLSTVSLLRDPASPPSPPVEKKEVALVQQPIITRNDIKEVHRYEEAIASGRAGGKEWRFLVSHVGGIYCSRFMWSPGPRHQGEICGPLEPLTEDILEPADLAYQVSPVMKNDRMNPVPVTHGHINSREVAEITLEICDGQKVGARMLYETELAKTFFMAFLPEGTQRVHVRATDHDGNSVLLSRPNVCS